MPFADNSLDVVMSCVGTMFAPHQLSSARGVASVRLADAPVTPASASVGPEFTREYSIGGLPARISAFLLNAL